MAGRPRPFDHSLEGAKPLVLCPVLLEVEPSSTSTPLVDYFSCVKLGSGSLAELWDAEFASGTVAGRR